MTARQGFLRGLAIGAALGAWSFTGGQILAQLALNRSIAYKEKP